MSVKIFITGDVMPRMGHSEAFADASAEIFREVKTFVSGADIAITNLEAPIIKGIKTPIKKSGPNLYTNEITIKSLKEIGFNIFTLANNHFFDQGQQGVESTLDACRHYGVEYLGGGKDINEARKVLYKEVNGKCIAIINVCEHEFSIANTDHGGSNPLDLIHIQEDITSARNKANHIVVIVHGGVEMFQLPTPRMKCWYRHFIDLGADTILNHHQHCVNGYELYKGKPIFYGLGNFYFPRRKQKNRNDLWDYGYAVMLTIDNEVSFELIPYTQDIKGIRLRDSVEFDNEIERLNHIITDDDLLQQEFDEFVIKGETNIMLNFIPSFLRNRIFDAIIRKVWGGRIYKDKQLYSLKNLLTCESHHERIQKLFNKMTS